MQKYELLLGKSAIPYEAINSLKYIYETKEIPKIEDFFSSLSQKNISIEEYKRVKQIFKHFKCQNLSQFIKIYCILDTILLAEVWSNFSNFGNQNYHLSPEFFFTLPSYGLECMYLHLYKKGILLENIQDKKMLDFLKQSLRGGFSGIGHSRLEFSKHFHNFNENYFENFKKEIFKYRIPKKNEILEAINFLEILSKKINTKNNIYYIDANNLYGGSQAQKMPLNNFKWASKLELDLIFGFFLNYERKIKNQVFNKDFLNLDDLLGVKNAGFFC